MVTYAWKTGSHFKADPKAVAQELETIEGPKTPNAVVEVARNPGSEMHSCFTWDDKEAAEKFRVEEARNLLRSLVIVFESKKEPQKQLQVRAYVNIQDADGQRSYQPVNQVMNHDDWRSEAFAQIHRGILELERKAEAYSEYDSALSEVQTGLKAIREGMQVAGASK